MSGSARKKRKHVEEINGPRLAMDLFVTVPKKTVSLSATDPMAGSLPQQVVLNRILARLAETGYHTIALTHTIYGRPRDPDDRVATALEQIHPLGHFTHPQQPHMRLTVRRRLHVVLENVSDMQIFAPQSSYQSLLQEYDLISVSPRNEQAFQMACTCDTFDIVTLEGAAASTARLPFKLRATDIRAIVQRSAVLEIAYATFVLNPTTRKGLIQTARELYTAAGGIAARDLHILCSSGNRIIENVDIGPMALRTPGDLANLWRVVLGLDPVIASNAVSRSGQVALDHASIRRRDEPQSLQVLDVSFVATKTDQFESKRGDDTIVTSTCNKPLLIAANESERENDSERGEDGFISF